MRVFVCSPFRGPYGQPSERNKELARRLMRAVFDAGHQPFVPHLLYPQVLDESAHDLALAFKANFKFLYVCDEMWIYARELAECSSGMKLEVNDVEASKAAMPRQAFLPWPRLVWMPPPFEAVESAMAKYDGETGVRIGNCARCGKMNSLNRASECLPCFAAGTPVPGPA